jgi:hypothetical protein
VSPIFAGSQLPGQSIDLSLGCLAVIGKTSRLPYRPRSRSASAVRHAREARSGTPIELQPQEVPLIAGRGVLFASPEYAPPAARFPARNSATIKLTTS